MMTKNQRRVSDMSDRFQRQSHRFRSTKDIVQHLLRLKILPSFKVNEEEVLIAFSDGSVYRGPVPGRDKKKG
jgi:hypothetical protein